MTSTEKAQNRFVCALEMNTPDSSSNHDTLSKNAYTIDGKRTIAEGAKESNYGDFLTMPFGNQEQGSNDFSAISSLNTIPKNASYISQFHQTRRLEIGSLKRQILPQRHYTPFIYSQHHTNYGTNITSIFTRRSSNNTIKQGVFIEDTSTSKYNTLANQSPTSNNKPLHECSQCGKQYKHRQCLLKHRWEHHTAWEETRKLCQTKHQQVQMLEAAQLLVDMGAIVDIREDKEAQHLERTASITNLQYPNSSITPQSTSKLKSQREHGSIK